MEVTIISEKNNNQNIQIAHHLLAHVLAKAVTELFDYVKLAIGSAIDNGFYYNFDIPCVITEKDFEQTENRMKEIIKRHEVFARKDIGADEAVKLFDTEYYKMELIKGVQDKEDIFVYYLGESFFDLFRSPYVSDSGKLNGWSYKISSVARAHWRDDEKNRMLQHICVYAYPSKAELRVSSFP